MSGKRPRAIIHQLRKLLRAFSSSNSHLNEVPLIETSRTRESLDASWCFRFLLAWRPPSLPRTIYAGRDNRIRFFVINNRPSDALDLLERSVFRTPLTDSVQGRVRFLKLPAETVCNKVLTSAAQTQNATLVSKAIDIAEALQLQGISIAPRTATVLLSSLGSLGTFQRGIPFLDRWILESKVNGDATEEAEPPADVVHVLSAALEAAAACDEPAAVVDVLSRMAHAGISPKSTPTMTSVIQCFMRLGQIDAAHGIVAWMHRSGLCPTSHNYVALMTLPRSHTVSSVTLMRRATEAFENMHSKGVVPSVHFYSAYIAVCGRARSLPAAQHAWKDMLSRSIMPNIVVFTSMVDTCGKCGDAAAALDTYQQMQSMGVVPNDRMYTSMLRALQKGSDPAAARRIWADARTAGAQLDAIAWTSYMSILLRAGDIEDAMSLLNEVTRASVLEYRLFNQVFANAAKNGNVDLIRLFEGIREAKSVPHTVLSVNWLLLLRGKRKAGVSRWRLAMGHEEGQVELQLSTAPELMPQLLASIDATPEQARENLTKINSRVLNGDPAAIVVAWLSVEGLLVEALELYSRIAEDLHADVRSWLLYALFAGARLEPPETRLRLVLDVMKEARAWSKASGWWWNTATHATIAAILRPAHENASVGKMSLD